MRRPIFTLLLSLIASAALVAQSSMQAKAGQAMSARYEDRQWQTIVPELSADSPQISILRVDPVTQATQPIVRVPKQIHVPAALAQRQ